MSFVSLSLPQKLEGIYRRLFETYGHQKWWPAESPFEMIVGAILTQSTAWTNVEKAIANLKKAEALNSSAIHSMPQQELAEMIRPSGYFNAKAKKLKAFAEHLISARNDSLDQLLRTETSILRKELLGIHGIGPETADSIVLYAAAKPSFVIDAYTHRIMERLDLNPDKSSYAALQSLFMENLPPDAELFNEYHALLVRLGKERCKRSKPVCPHCCLSDICRWDQRRSDEADHLV